VDALKIDRYFVMRMAVDESAVEIVRSTIMLGHKLGLHVIAEGVEDQATFDLLAAFDCDAAQGFFLCHPVPPPEFLQWLSQSSLGLEHLSNGVQSRPGDGATAHQPPSSTALPASPPASTAAATR
jgi:predicted signal transduction protein with EAL and GGDEF domain